MVSSPGAHDCDCDGVPDSLDARAGRASDVNQNGQDDVCDDDPAVRRLAWSEDWRKLAAARDTAALLVRHQCEHEVWIRYTVPQGGADVRLTARAPSGDIVGTLLRRHADSGAYDLVWDETDDHGAPFAGGNLLFDHAQDRPTSVRPDRFLAANAVTDSPRCRTSRRCESG